MSGSTASARQVIATCIGNALEWYDFTIYGFMAVTISKLFFPAGAEGTALLSTLAVFGAAFLVRPFGGLVLSHYADRFGRKSMLFVVIGLMTVGMALIAFAPTYATVGIAAPVVMLVARLVQGLSAGGEFGSAMSFLIEHAPANRRGLYGGWQQSSQGAATLLAGVVGGTVAAQLTPDELHSWGWRIPFLIGLVIGPVGFYMRLKLQETPEFLAHRAASSPSEAMPIRLLVAGQKKRLLAGMGLVLGGAATVYVLFIFMPTYAIRVLKLDLQASFSAPLIGGAMLMIFCPLFGLLSDYRGRKMVMGVSIALFLLIVYPSFVWLNAAPSVGRLAAVEVAFGLLMAGYAGPFGAALAEMFSVGVRVTGMSTVYNFGIAIFGGFAPLIIAWLIGVTGNPLAPAYYVMAGLLLSLTAMMLMPASPPSGERHSRSSSPAIASTPDATG
jgi:MFS family permease